MNYRESCNHQASMWSVRRTINAFCDYICALREAGKISAEVAERQTSAAGDVEYDIDDHCATAATWQALAKIREFNRKHHLAA